MIRLTILGEPASKANSRELATVGPKDKRRTIFRKSDKALDFESSALLQIPPAARVRLECEVAVDVRIFYASRRPDLDESVVLDVLQDRWKPAKKDKAGNEISPRTLVQSGVYRNDRQVCEKHVWRRLDKANPRVEIKIRPIGEVQADLLAAGDVIELEGRQMRLGDPVTAA